MRALRLLGLLAALAGACTPAPSERESVPRPRRDPSVLSGAIARPPVQPAPAADAPGRPDLPSPPRATPAPDGPPLAEPLTLERAYRLAIERSETLALNIEELERLQALYDQAFGSVLPRLSFKGSYIRQDPAGASGGGSFQSRLNLTERSEYKFFARQPLFSGLKEVYAMRQARAASAAKREEIEYARLRLYADVAGAFTAVLQTDRDLTTVQDSLRLAEERLQELQARRRAGISRQTEVLAQEAEAASTRARLEELRGARNVAVEALRFLTGARGELTPVDGEAAPVDPPPVGELLARAAKQRADLRALENEIAASGEAVGVARAGHFPTLALEGNAYTHREGNSEDVAWDLTLSGELPIFDGLTTRARVREAKSNVRSAELRLERLRRQIALEVSRAYFDVVSLRSELDSREKAVASAAEFHELVQAEYRRDIATNIEVLAAFNTLQQARLERDRTRFQWRLASIRLSVECGESPGGDSEGAGKR
ncbi:MAG: TolC family protein [Planctomycetes bacterium]|nr:TolC family protein [Planctomycetota bacterium]